MPAKATNCAAICAAMLLAACAAAQVSGDAHDPFVLMIDAGRMGVFNDRIKNAMEMAEAADKSDEAEFVHAARGARQAALDFLALKERACAEGKFTAAACAPARPPAWLAEAPERAISPGEARRRIDEVQKLMTPLMAAACDYGRTKSGDGLFCSVE